MNTLEYVHKVRAGEISPVETTEKILKEIEKINKEYNYFNAVSRKLALELAQKAEKSKGKLAGLPVSIKDNICVKNVESTAGSKILKGYYPPFNATIVQRIIDEGGVIIGKTSQDEFGFGGFSINVGIGFKIPRNPYDKERATGGSSGGAAGFTSKTEFSHIAIGESTGGSIANPASFCGVVGMCPTYGLVSRYGLIDYANSLDKIGPMGKTVAETRLMMDVIAGHDSKDSTSLNEKLKIRKVKKVGVVKESLEIDKEIKDLVLGKLEGVKYEKVSLPLVKKYGIPTYYLIAMSEASTNLAKFCGMRYGHSKQLKGMFNEYFSEVRSEAFGKEAKRRIIVGTFARMAGYRDAYYLKAMKTRTKIIEEYKKAFKKYDVLISPTMPITAPKFSEIEKLTPLENYMMDVLTVGPNLAGLPHLNLNAGFKKKMPVGIMLIGDHLTDYSLFEFGEEIE